MDHPVTPEVLKFQYKRSLQARGPMPKAEPRAACQIATEGDAFVVLNGVSCKVAGFAEWMMPKARRLLSQGIDDEPRRCTVA